MGLPGVDPHCEAWRRNRKRAGEYHAAFETDCPDWSIVLKFYAAMHLTQGYLASKSAVRFDAKSHAERERAIKESPELGRRFAQHYKALKALSENVRYEPEFQPRGQDFEAAESGLLTVESFLKNRLRDKGATVD